MPGIAGPRYASERAAVGCRRGLRQASKRAAVGADMGCGSAPAWAGQASKNLLGGFEAMIVNAVIGGF